MTFRAKLRHQSKAGNDIMKAKATLLQRIELWRAKQAQLMPQVFECLTTAKYDDLLCATLHLPTDCSLSDICQYKLEALLKEEVVLREAQLQDFVLHLQLTVSSLSLAGHAKKSSARGQAPNTRANDLLNQLKDYRDALLDDYNWVRAKLTKLDVSYARDFKPALTKADLFKKLTEDGRNVGDSKRLDGALWAYRPDDYAGPSHVVIPEEDDGETDFNASSFFHRRAHTVMHRYQGTFDVIIKISVLMPGPPAPPKCTKRDSPKHDEGLEVSVQLKAPSKSDVLHIGITSNLFNRGVWLDMDKVLPVSNV
jgi:hypothetical protein